MTELYPSDEHMIMDQAAHTASRWLSHGIKEIDRQLGDGYAEKHPELLAGFISAAGKDEIAMYLHRIDEAISDLASAQREGNDVVEKSNQEYV